MKIQRVALAASVVVATSIGVMDSLRAEAITDQAAPACTEENPSSPATILPAACGQDPQESLGVGVALETAPLGAEDLPCWEVYVAWGRREMFSSRDTSRLELVRCGEVSPTFHLSAQGAWMKGMGILLEDLQAEGFTPLDLMVVLDHLVRGEVAPAPAAMLQDAEDLEGTGLEDRPSLGVPWVPYIPLPPSMTPPPRPVPSPRPNPGPGAGTGRGTRRMGVSSQQREAGRRRKARRYGVEVEALDKSWPPYRPLPGWHGRETTRSADVFRCDGRIWWGRAEACPDYWSATTPTEVASVWVARGPGVAPADHAGEPRAVLRGGGVPRRRLDGERARGRGVDPDCRRRWSFAHRRVRRPQRGHAPRRRQH